MKWLVDMQAVAPLFFRSERTQAGSRTLSYVPGTSVLGALAQAHQTLRRPPAEFARFFLGDAVRLSNLYPARFADKMVREDRTPVQPLPATARSCKRFPGFAADAEDPRDAPHGVTDGLIPLALFALDGERNPKLMEPLRACPRCADHRPLDHIEGFFRRASNGTMARAQAEAAEVRTRSAISYRIGTVKPELLYSRAVIAAGTLFWGQWDIADAVAADFEAFIEQASEGGWIRLGNNRTRSLGRVSIGYAPRGTVDTAAALEERVRSFSTAVQAHAAAHGVKLDAPAYAPLTLTSDMILYDRLLRPRLAITNDDLAAFPGLEGAQVMYMTGDVQRVAGWNDLWGLPRADEWAIKMGSVAFIALPDLTEAVCKALFQLQEAGLGQRRSGGYGRLVVADPIHLIRAGDYR